jgi:hypothetical protein
MRHSEILNYIARKKLDKPLEWEWFYARHLDDNSGLLLKGGIPRIITRGKRKGQKTWGGKGDETFISYAEIAAVKAELLAGDGMSDKIDHIIFEG